MSETTTSLRQKIKSASSLKSVVRTMKAITAASIGPYEKSVHALIDYTRTVELALGACFRASHLSTSVEQKKVKTDNNEIYAIVFGSDQGLVGQFNDVIAQYVIDKLAAMPGKPQIWAVGERVQSRLAEAGLPIMGLFSVPNSVQAITPLIGEIQVEIEARTSSDSFSIFVFHNHPLSGSVYEPISQRLLPLDSQWQQSLIKKRWPTQSLPEVMRGGKATIMALIREYFFISLFRACAESLASENASRLAAMERADKNISELLETLHSRFQRLRHSSIDEELFDVISGYEALES